jgi:hypothetical protein
MAMTKASVAWKSLLGKTLQELHSWKPQLQSSELAYRNALIDYLREVAPEARIQKEYRHSGTTADLHLKWDGFFSSDEIFFELKRNLTKKAECDRLIGQIEALDPRKNKVIVVIFEQCETALLQRLRSHYKNMMTEPFTLMDTPKSMDIIVKAPAARAKRARAR